MLKLLIIDDEEPIRYLIRNLVPYEQLGISVVGEAGDGNDGIRMCKELNPDIVFTDIRMPEMDGLTMMEKVRKERILVKIILISGYDDFSYAQRAIKAGAFDYILKPIKEYSIVEALEKAKKTLLHEKKETDLIYKTKIELKKLQETIIVKHNDSLSPYQGYSLEIEKSLQYIDENYSNELSLEEVAEKVFLSTTYFSKLFKREVGKGFNEYVNYFRINKAKSLLELPELKINEICNMVGYSDTSYFIKVFKNLEGVGPSEYRHK